MKEPANREQQAAGKAKLHGVSVYNLGDDELSPNSGRPEFRRK